MSEMGGLDLSRASQRGPVMIVLTPHDAPMAGYAFAGVVEVLKDAGEEAGKAREI